MTAVWYRVEDGRYAPSVDEWDNVCGESTPFVHVYEYQVLRETPKGVWLKDAGRFGQERFVLRGAHKRFACPTKAEALESFRARKRRQAKILRGQLRHVEEVLELSQGIET